ncbi:hypothetical protein DL764_005398 [Monosporascus ibericus]|uniref:Alpha-1,3-mannosyltransferase n=1 Tax=Monosporascus ibericus TaxID=155417 RepID=A0A4V1XAK3_9PEZI|nr:hypothetical protein DL764_005398 [Monosporascus ibericus]
MPPHLHPRSRMTSSLFATTLLASFFVVALPHVLPCPAPRVAYADSTETESITVANPDGTTTTRRRRPRRKAAEVKDGIAAFEGREEDFEEEQKGGRPRPRQERECPVPKPGGVIAELIGFRGDRPTGGGRPGTDGRGGGGGGGGGGDVR